VSSADVLRQLAAADVAQAATDGAAALDQAAQLEATIAGLQASLDAAAAQLAAIRPELYTVRPGDTLSGIAKDQAIVGGDWHSIVTWNGLASTTIRPGQSLLLLVTSAPDPQPQPTPAARFPGDPGPGKLVVGAIVSGHAGDADAWEKATGAKLGEHRVYYRAGIGDLAGPALAFIDAEHTAGRMPVVSIKPGLWADVAAGKFDAQLAAFAKAVESRAKPVKLIVNHEPQNDLTGLPKGGQLGTAADFRAAQARVRKAIGTGLQRLSFGGSLMAYGWTSQGVGKFGSVDDWFPGPGVWDWCGIDQYAQQSGAPIDDAKFKAATASMAKWGVPPAITELGIRSSDPQGPAKLAALIDKAVAAGYVAVDWYDSDNNSTQNGWVLTGPLLAAFVALCQDPRAVRPAA
jgi:hypothetical protein